jgi:hypothetical protein
MSKDKVVRLDSRLVGSTVTCDPPCGGCGSLFGVVEQSKRHRQLVVRCHGCGRFIQVLNRAEVFSLVRTLRALQDHLRVWGGDGAAA